jgi:hypothetical protein
VTTAFVLGPAVVVGLALFLVAATWLERFARAANSDLNDTALIETPIVSDLTGPPDPQTSIAPARRSRVREPEA